MKSSLEIAPKLLHLPGGKGDRTDDWVSLFMQYMPVITELLERRVSDEDRIAFSDELAASLGFLASFAYLSRAERDRALAAGFTKWPKGTENSDAQVALARNFASSEVRMRELIKELQEAVQTRLSINQSALRFIGNRIAAAGA